MNVHDLEFRWANLARIDEGQAAKLDNVVLESGDVLLNITGASIARCCALPPSLLPARVNQHVSIVRPRKELIDSAYLAYFLVSPAAKSALLETGEEGGSTRQALTKGQLQAFPIAFPPLEEQRRIVAVLDEAFEGLARARENAEANLQNARELFDGILISAFRGLDKRARRLTLAEASTDFGRGRSRHRPRNAPFLYGGPYPFIQTGDIRQAPGVLTDFTQAYSELGLAQSKLWPVGTVCITIAANIAETAVLGIDACFPDSVIGMVPNPQITSSSYVEYMLRYFSADLKKQGKGSAQDNINLATFEHTTFPFPESARQSDVAGLLDKVQAETSLLEQAHVEKLEDLDQLRQSLLQKAFAGELT